MMYQNKKKVKVKHSEHRVFVDYGITLVLTSVWVFLPGNGPAH